MVIGGSLAVLVSGVGRPAAPGTADVDAPQLEASFAQPNLDPDLDPLTLVVDEAVEKPAQAVQVEGG